MIVYKYELVSGGRTVLSLPAGTEILCVQVQRRILNLWTMVDPGSEMIEEVEHRAFVAVPTGGEVQGDVVYIGTAQMQNGRTSVHVFEELNQDPG